MDIRSTGGTAGDGFPTPLRTAHPRPAAYALRPGDEADPGEASARLSAYYRRPNRWTSATTHPRRTAGERGCVRHRGVVVGLGLLLVSAALLLAGAELFAEHAAAAGRWLGVTGLAVGVLLAGAEPEELLTAVTAAARGHPGIAVGDAIGANVTMLTLALGLAAVIRPLPAGGRVRTYAVLAAAAGALAALVLVDGRLSRVEGLALVVAYVVLVAVVWLRERQPPMIGELAETLADDDDEVESEPGALKVRERAGVGLALVVGGIAVMAVGGVFAVQGAVRVVEALSVSDTAVGLTLVALATTAELLALAWAAARRDVSELAVAAIVGSAAYNATATLGAAALVHPAGHIDVRVAAIAAAVLPLVTLGLAGRDHQLGRRPGFVLLAMYGVFVAVVLR
jgi:cation:H+ antiporter